MPEDQAVSTLSTAEMFFAERAFCDWVLVMPTQEITDATSVSFESKQAAFTNPRLSTSAAQERAFVVSSSCERPDKAVDLINYIYENAEVANILNYGIEGKDFEYVSGSDKIIQYPEGIDSSNVGWNRVVSYFGDGMETNVMVPATMDYYDDLRKFNEDAVPTASFGYLFDSSELATQVANCTAVVTEYAPDLIYGVVPEEELDAYLEKLNAELENAGINDIIAENQRQLDEWLK